MTAFAEHEIDGTIGARLRKLAIDVPDRLALVEGASTWTFRQFLEKCETYAEPFSKLDKSAPIVLIMGEEAQTLFVLYGAILAGVPVIPIDIAMPPPNMASALTRCQLVFTASKSRNAVEAMALGLPVAVTPDDVSRIAAQRPGGTDQATCSSSAAIIYMTSGTTGVPKGVVVDHDRILYTAWARSQNKHYPEGARLGLMRSFAYSGTAYVIFTGFLNGATIVLADFREASQNAFSRLVEQQNISDLNLTPSHLRALARHLGDRGSRWQPQVVTVSGEPLFYDDLVALRRDAGWTCPVVNLYGSAEIGPIAEWVVDEEASQEHDVVPVGHALRGRRIEIHDDSGRPLPPGEAGEIVVFGEHFGQGYWHNPSATAEKFGPMAQGGPSRYRTGDVGMLDQCGLLHHMGRQDTKVKIRGHLVELRSVERVIRGLAGVRNAAVKMRETPRGDPVLVGYAERSSERAVTSHGLRKALDGLLPDYAIPRRLIVLDSFPLTAGGKVDLNALPEPGKERPDGMPPYDAPVGELEVHIGRVWSDVLEIKNVGRHDDFFDLGGDSLGAVTVALQLQQDLSLQVDLGELFLNPTIKNMAEIVATQTRAHSFTF